MPDLPTTNSSLFQRFSLEWVIGIVFLAGVGWMGLGAAQEDIQSNSREIQDMQIDVTALKIDLIEVKTNQNNIRSDIEEVKQAQREIQENQRRTIELLEKMASE